MKENQKVLYDHYVKLSKEGKTDKMRADAKFRAAEILKSFPDFAKAKAATPAAIVAPKEPKTETASVPGGQ